MSATRFTPPAWRGPAYSFPVPEPGAELQARYRGCLLGGAIGDALGRPVEGWTRTAIEEAHPDGLRDFIPNPGWKTGPRGTYTDDTQLTIEIAEWLVDAGADEPDGAAFARRLVDWLPRGRGVGVATGEGVRRLSAGEPWWAAGPPSAGNGAAMRAAPYGLRYAGQPDALRTTAAVGSVTTHADATAVASAIVQAAAVNQCLTLTPETLDAGSFLQHLVAAVDDLGLPELPQRVDPSTTRSLVQQIESVHDVLGRPAAEVFDHFGNSAFVLETTPVVLWGLLDCPDDAERSLVQMVMGGGDADTNAAMLGNLLGALNGEDALPQRWTGTDLEDAELLRRLADDLYAQRWT